MATSCQETPAEDSTERMHLHLLGRILHAFPNWPMQLTASQTILSTCVYTRVIWVAVEWALDGESPGTAHVTQPIAHTEPRYLGVLQGTWTYFNILLGTLYILYVCISLWGIVSVSFRNKSSIMDVYSSLATQVGLVSGVRMGCTVELEVPPEPPDPPKQGHTQTEIWATWLAGTKMWSEANWKRK